MQSEQRSNEQPPTKCNQEKYNKNENKSKNTNQIKLKKGRPVGRFIQKTIVDT